MLVGSIAAAVIFFYGYLATSRTAHPFRLNAGATEYYHYLSDGFRAGQLSLTVKPDPELATLADPYDPPARQRIGHPGLADASYYHGKYYLYFGVAPALALFLPFKLLTGLHFPEGLACALFCGGGFLSSLAIFLRLRRRYFPHAPAGIVGAGTLMLGTANLCVMMLTRAQFYEVPIAAAYFFSCLALAWLVRSLDAGNARRWWLALAGAAFGGAMASRPHFVLAAAILPLVLAGPGFRWKEKFRDACALGLPIAVVGFGLLLYNYLRFDSPFDFGQKYQLGGSNQPKMRLVTAESVPANLYYYFWAPARWSRYFPFVETIRPFPGTLPRSYFGVEDPFGLLPNLPCFWLAVAAPFLWLADRRRRAGLGRRLLLFGGFFLPICGFTLFFVSATNRYMVDFLPPLLLTVTVGLLLANARFELAGRSWRWLRWPLLGGLVVYSAFFSAMAAFQHNGLFQIHQPAMYQRIGRWLNTPTAAWERFSGQRFGPVQMTVRFSQDSLGKHEPLLVTGSGLQADFVYIFYAGTDTIQLGFTHAGDAGVTSEPIAMDYGIPHRIGIEAGSLYPPASHPMFSALSATEVSRRKRHLLVTFDGVPYLDREQAFYDVSPGDVFVGRNPVSEYAGKEFRGRLIEVIRGALPPAVAPFAGGDFLQLGLELPKAALAGRREALVVTGKEGASDTLFAVYEDDLHVRLGFSHAGGETILSEPLPALPGQVQRLEASFGSFYPAPRNGTERELASALAVRWNDRNVWMTKADFHPANGVPPSIGRTPWGPKDDLADFTGRIVSQRPVPSPVVSQAEGLFAFQTYWIERSEPGYGPLRLHLVFPADQMGKFEPLLVSGPSVGQADYVWVQYVDSARVVIGYEHTGGGGPREVIPAALAERHVLEISAPSLYPAPGDPFFAGQSLFEATALKSRFSIFMDGVKRIDASVKAYEAAPSQATPGENRLSTTFGQKFSGRLTRVERGIFAPPAGFMEKSGPLELIVTWPEAPLAGKKELLLATGTEATRNQLFVAYEGDGRAHLAASDGQGREVAGFSFGLAAAGRQSLRVDWGGFELTAPSGPGVPGRQLSVDLDGTNVLRTETNFVRAKPQKVWIGTGLAGDPAFSGVIHAVARLPAAAPATMSGK